MFGTVIMMKTPRIIQIWTLDNVFFFLSWHQHRTRKIQQTSKTDNRTYSNKNSSLNTPGSYFKASKTKMFLFRPRSNQERTNNYQELFLILRFLPEVLEFGELFNQSLDQVHLPSSLEMLSTSRKGMVG